MKLPIKNNLHLLHDYGDFIVYGEYISCTQCKITILRFDTDNGWDTPLNLIVNEDNIEIPPSSSSYRTYEIYMDKENLNFYSGNEIIVCSEPDLNRVLYTIDINYPQKIPKVIIQTQEEYKETNAVSSLKGLNPEYEYRFFNNTECRHFIKENFDKDVLEAYDILIPTAFKADLFRYCYLYKNGGCYFDFKVIARVPLRDIIKQEDEFLICVDYERSNSLNRNVGTSYLNAVIMTVRGNEQLLKLINICVDNILHKQHHFLNCARYGCIDILNITGPTLMFSVIRDGITDNNLRFKHIIEHNDETYYGNFKIVDIDTRQLLFTKTDNHYLKDNRTNNNHYSKLWERRELFFTNPTYISNLKIYVYPHPYQDKFKFEIDNQKINVIRTDSDENWWLDLNIRIINDETSEYKDVNIGRQKCVEMDD